MQTDTPIRLDLEDVTSSNIKAFGYDLQRKIFAVQFKSDHVYHYAGVPVDTAIRFQVADSKGRFYVEEIKGKFTGELMTGECPNCGAVGYGGDRCVKCDKARYQIKPMAAKHYVWSDEPTVAKRSKRATCGVYVTTREMVTDADKVTCEQCKRNLDVFNEGEAV
jgi:hypothetical protein